MSELGGSSSFARGQPLTTTRSAAQVRGQDRLRVGVLVESLRQPLWLYDALHQLVASEVADLVVLVRDDPSSAANGRPQRPGLMLRAYSRVDRLIFLTGRDPCALTDISPVLSTCEVIVVEPDLQDRNYPLSGPSLEKVSAHQLDVLLNLRRRPPTGRALDVARYGVWAFYHGDHSQPVPFGFAEVIAALPVTSAGLLVSSPRGSQMIYRSWTATDLLSVSRTTVPVYWKSSHFLSRKLRDVYYGDTLEVEDGSPAPAPAPARLGARCEATSPFVSTRVAITTARRVAARSASQVLRRKLAPWHWSIAFHFDSGVRRGCTPHLRLTDYEVCQPPRGVFWADPFAISAAGRYFVFIEEYVHRTRRAHIAVLEFDPQRGWSEATTVLSQNYHLSYPCVFEWNGSWYMIPETSDNRTIELYRAIDFPWRWENETVLLRDLIAADATVACIDGSWWMFATVAVEGTRPWDELHIYHARAPFGPWRPHRGNPVKSDVRSARPAGHLFQGAATLVRPAQDSSGRYGNALVLNQVETLSTVAYSEVARRRLAMTHMGREMGTHTINAACGLSVIDMRVPKREPRWLLPRFGHDRGRSFSGA